MFRPAAGGLQCRWSPREGAEGHPLRFRTLEPRGIYSQVTGTMRRAAAATFDDVSEPAEPPLPRRRLRPALRPVAARPQRALRPCLADVRDRPPECDRVAVTRPADGRTGAADSHVLQFEKAGAPRRI